jgi:dodecin
MHHQLYTIFVHLIYSNFRVIGISGGSIRIWGCESFPHTVVDWCRIFYRKFGLWGYKYLDVSGFVRQTDSRSIHKYSIRNQGGKLMQHNVYKKIEITGSSDNSIEEAVRSAVQRASQTIRNMRWFEVVETRGTIENGAVSEWQVTVKIGFTLDEA